jgi:hypothetical protein
MVIFENSIGSSSARIVYETSFFIAIYDRNKKGLVSYTKENVRYISHTVDQSSSNAQKVVCQLCRVTLNNQTEYVSVVITGLKCDRFSNIIQINRLHQMVLTPLVTITIVPIPPNTNY